MVLMYVPLMKELNIDWNTLKTLPRTEIQALTQGLHEYTLLHAYDGYTDKDISEMAKNKPEIRSDYAKYKEQQRKYQKILKLEKKPMSLGALLS